MICIFNHRSCPQVVLDQAQKPCFPTIRIDSKARAVLVFVTLLSFITFSTHLYGGIDFGHFFFFSSIKQTSVTGAAPRKRSLLGFTFGAGHALSLVVGFCCLVDVILRCVILAAEHFRAAGTVRALEAANEYVDAFLKSYVVPATLCTMAVASIVAVWEHRHHLADIF
jgi:hypothetical protein